MVVDLKKKDQFKFEEIILQGTEVPSFHKSVVIPNGDIYLIGGTRKDGTKSGEILRYDNMSKSLVKEADEMKEARSSFGISFMRNNIYVIGGIGKNDKYLSSCERFNLKTKKWESLNSLNLACASFSCTPLNNRFIFKIGGCGQDRKLIHAIEKYDILLNKWILLSNAQVNPQTPLPPLLSNSSALQIGPNDILVFGGYDNNNVGSSLTFILRVDEKKE